jgi:hypothetical protein
MAAKLQAIERAQRSAAEARLSVARREVDEASERAGDARDDLVEAERSWTDRIAGGRFNLELQLCLAEELLRKEQESQTSDREQRDAETRFDQRKRDWQQLETGVRAGDHLLKKGRRYLLRRAEAARDHSLSDQTTWKWFKR